MLEVCGVVFHFSYSFLGGAGRCCCLVFGGEGVGVLRVGVVDFVCLLGGGVVVLPLCGVGTLGLGFGFCSVLV